MTYLDKILYLYPDAQGVMYWHTQQDGTPWENPFEGLVFENPNFPVPTKEDLDSLEDEVVADELRRREEVRTKTERDRKYAQDLSVVASFRLQKETSKDLTFSEHLDALEAESATLEAELRRE